jgi:hypothetical protein
MRDVKNAYKILVLNLKGRHHLEDLGVDANIILEYILGKWGGKVWAGEIQLRIETSGGFFYSNEPSGSIRGEEFLD